MIKVELEQGSEEWIAFRRNHIGASDAGIIMGVGFRTAYALWDEKVNGTKTFINDAMQRGTDLEPEARRIFEAKMGRAFPPAVVKHDEISWIAASLDGICEETREILEIKTPNKKDHAEALNGRVPEKYWPQVQHQLFVTGYEWGYYVSFDGKEIAMVEFQRDDEYIARLLVKEEAFWNRVIMLDAPEMKKIDYVQREDAEWERLVAQKKEIAPKLKELEFFQERDEEIKKRLIELSEGKSSQGFGLFCTFGPRKGNVDYKAIPQLKGVDLEPYRKKSIQVCTLKLELGG